MVGVGSIVSVGGAGGGSGGGGSGITNINPGDNTGPTVTFDGVNGIDVTGGSNVVVIDGASLSGLIGTIASSGTLCYAATFTSITSNTFAHNLGSTNVVVDVFDGSDNQLQADRVGIVDLNNVIVEFNRPQTGKIVVVACVSDTSATALLCEAKRYALLVS